MSFRSFWFFFTLTNVESVDTRVLSSALFCKQEEECIVGLTRATFSESLFVLTFFFHSFIGCSSCDIQYKFIIQHKKKEQKGKKSKNPKGVGTTGLTSHARHHCSKLGAQSDDRFRFHVECVTKGPGALFILKFEHSGNCHLSICKLTRKQFRYFNGIRTHGLFVSVAVL